MQLNDSNNDNNIRGRDYEQEKWGSKQQKNIIKTKQNKKERGIKAKRKKTRVELKREK